MRQEIEADWHIWHRSCSIDAAHCIVSPGRRMDPHLQKKGLDTVGVDHVLAGRPGNNCETTVLGSDEGDGVALIVDKLSGGNVARPAQLGRVHYFGCGSHDG